MKNSQLNSKILASVYCNVCGKLYPDKKSHEIHKISLIRIPSLLLDSYQFLDVLGKGTYGIVFKVIDKNDEDLKALKFLLIQDGNDDNDLEILKQLHHQNVIRYYGSHKKIDEGYIAILMELADMDLHQFLDKGLFKNEQQKFQFALQLTDAIKYLHYEVKVTKKD